MARKKQYQIVNRSEKRVMNIEIDGKNVPLPPGKDAYVHDEGLAKEIDARHGARSREKEGGKVLVIPVDDRDPSYEPGHRYTFTQPDMSGFIGHPDYRKKKTNGRTKNR